MRLADYDTDNAFDARVVASLRITPESTDEVRELVFDVAGHHGNLAAGQSVGVLAPGNPEFGQKHHFRLYTVADHPEDTGGGNTRIRLAVKRCTYIDEYSGEQYDGVASNYLCDLAPGDTVKMTGPYGLAFPIPKDPSATLILIGAGTGIAPFRAFLKHLYLHRPDFHGRVVLFHGARSGLDLLYGNDANNDLNQFYDKETFEAIEVMSHRPHWTSKLDWTGAIQDKAEELLRLLANPHTHVYVAGLEEIRDHLDEAFIQALGDELDWDRRKAELVAGGRWVELLY